MNRTFSRRGFLLGLGALPAIARARKPTKVLILGAGISGLTAAYELSRNGYEVQILEASFRAGGRNLTLRGGDRIDETGFPQVCEFDRDPDLYFDAGPSRIPGHHAALLRYCRELGVELQPFVNSNRNAWVQDDAMLGGQPIRAREYLADTRGFIAERIAKSPEPDGLREYARQLGDLDSNLAYRGSRRAGLARHDFTRPEQLKAPRDAGEQLRSRVMAALSFGDTEPVMLVPVGGMDRIVAGFLRKIGHLVQLDSQVQSIRVLSRGVEVTYRRDGEYVTARADYVLNCIPMHLIAGMEHNFPREYAAGFTAIPRGKLLKIGLQMKERFWEREGIYGGISCTTQDIRQIWYPSHGFHGKKGVVLGAYAIDGKAGEKIARLAPADRIALAIRQGEKIHPLYGSFVENGVSVAWHQMNHMLGCAAEWDESLLRQWFDTLQAPVGNHYLIGDQVSYHSGWQEGAIASAHHAIADLDARERAAA